MNPTDPQHALEISQFASVFGLVAIHSSIKRERLPRINGYSGTKRLSDNPLVYKAVDEDNSPVVIKRNNPFRWGYRSGEIDDQLALRAAKESLENEFNIMRHLNHAGFVQPIELIKRRRYSLVMEDAGDYHLSAMEDLNHVSLTYLMIEAAKHIRDAHEKGIVHRDIKPHNIMYIPNEGLVRIIDLGLAARSNDLLEKRSAGTPQYMAPEQFESNLPNPAMDVYSWAASFVYLMFRKLPRVVEEKVVGDQPFIIKPDFEAKPNYSQGAMKLCFGNLGRVVNRALDPDPNQRPKMAEVVFEGLAYMKKNPL
tara:strand:+ start:1119 stop:2048 length:930 start_codon:yes stop_codon:yes gene_type:complete